MIRTFTLACLLFSCFALSAQQNQQSVPLAIKLNGYYDKTNEIAYYVIRPQGDNPYAQRLNGLKPFILSKKAPEGYHYPFADSSGQVYNLFRSENEALLFLSAEGWELVSVNNQIASEAALNPRWDNQVYTHIYAEPVYYFKKIVQR